MSRFRTRRFPAGRCRPRSDMRGRSCSGRSAACRSRSCAGGPTSTRASPPIGVAFGVRVLGRLGIRSLVVTNAAGGINPDFRPGLLVLISDHVNLQGTSVARRPERRFARPALRGHERCIRRRAACADAGGRRASSASSWPKASTPRGSGPQFETPAEIRFMRAVGGDLAGMSTVQEVIAARHMGIRVLGISVVTNMAAGVTSAEDRPRGGARGRRGRGGVAHCAPARARSYTFRVKLRDLPSVDELLRDERLAAEPHELVLAAARTVLERAREEIKAGGDPGSIVDDGPRGARSRAAAVPAAGGERDRRSRAYEPRSRTPREGRARARDRGRRRLLEPRVRPRARRAWVASGSPRRAAAAF